MAYSASKGAVMAITKALAIELAPYNIRVNCINPGPTDTPMSPKFIHGFNEQILEEIKGRVPLGWLVKPEDVAHAALFLASDETSTITGVALNVDSDLYIARGKN
jgi:3-oxoacyl-[acyl-carrier protein] reductase